MAHMSILSIIPIPYLTLKPNILPIAIMPRTIFCVQREAPLALFANPTRTYTRFSLWKCARLRLVHNLSLRGAARALGVNHTLLIRWKAKLSALKVAHGKSCCRVNKEHIGQIDPVKEELLAWIFTRCNQRITVTKSQVVFKASAKIHYFGVKSFKACFKSVSCFLGQHGYVYCLKTNEALHLPHEVYMRPRRHSISSWQLVSSSLVPTAASGTFGTWTKCPFGFPTNGQKL